MTKKLNKLKKHLKAGQVYRRSDLTKWSNAVDRHLQALLECGTLTKISGGLYHCPKKTSFGEAHPDEKKLVETFLKDHRFLLTSPNAYNALGVGTTQLYNETIVYNHKRHGQFKLGGRVFNFRVKHFFPKKVTTEFLLVDLVNNLDNLAEDNKMVLEHVKKKLLAMEDKALWRAVQDYGSMWTKRFFENIREENNLNYAA